MKSSENYMLNISYRIINDLILNYNIYKLIIKSSFNINILT